MCSSMYSSVNLSLCTQSACFILSQETLARGETRLWEVQMKKAEEEEEADTESRKGVWNCRDKTFNFSDKTQKRKQTLLLAVTPIPSSAGWGAARLLHLHNSKGQSMEEGPFVRNCQRRQGPQAWSPRVKSAYLGCHSDMTGPQGQGRGVKLLTTLNVTPALLYYERHAKRLTSSTVTKDT